MSLSHDLVPLLPGVFISRKLESEVESNPQTLIFHSHETTMLMVLPTARWSKSSCTDTNILVVALIIMATGDKRGSRSEFVLLT